MHVFKDVTLARRSRNARLLITGDTPEPSMSCVTDAWDFRSATSA